MSSKILSVSEKTRRQFLQQKITYRDPCRVGWSLVVSVLSAREIKILELLLECMNQNQFLVVYIISLF